MAELKLTRGKGGNRHPLSPRQFILDHLGAVGRDYVAGMHRAYKVALGQAAADRDRPKPYHTPKYSSFCNYVEQLAREGKIKPTGQEEKSDAPQFADSGYGWLRRYYELA